MKIKITKRFLLSLCLMTLTLLCGGNKAWAADATVTSTFKDQNWSVGAGEPSWTSSGAATNAFESRGVQITLKNINASASGLKLSNSSIKDLGNIKSITLTVSANGAGGKISNVKVGSTSFLNNGNSSYTVVKENNQTVTFETNTPIAGDIVISFSSTADSKSLYIKSISVTYQEASTPTLEYTVSWKVNGADYTEGTPTTKVKSGSAVTTLPTAPSDIAGRTFVGWTNAEITTSSVSAPAILFTKAVNAPTVTDNVTYYAVFASASGTGETSEELTGEEIVNLGLLAYATEKTYSGDKLKYSIFGYKDSPSGAKRPWIQLNKDQGVYIKITAPDNITKMNLKISSATNLKDGIDDISKHTAFDDAETVGLVTEDCTFTNSSENIGSILGSKIDDNLVTIETTSASKVVYLKVSKGARIWGITTYFSDLTYSNYATTVPLSFSFSDTDDLTEYLPASNLADQTVTLDRKVYSGWNTFCVPFALTQAQLEEAYGSGAVAKYLSGVTTDGAAATLHFTPEEGGGIKANKAYLLYLTADVTEAKTFSGVTLEPAGLCTTTVSDENGGEYTFQGILKPTTLTTDNTQYFLNSLGTNFVLPSNSTSAMKATRAYITVPAASGSAQGRQYSFDFNGTTTGIDNVNISGLEDGAWYTISGIRVNRPAAKGVYIHNGRKVIVK